MDAALKQELRERAAKTIACTINLGKPGGHSSGAICRHREDRGVPGRFGRYRGAGPSSHQVWPRELRFSKDWGEDTRPLEIGR